MSKTSTLHEYARIGAAAQLTELRAEMAAIAKAFPDLAGRVPARPGRPKAQPVSPALAKLMDPAAKRKRRKMSAAGRKAISEAQKKRWAALKARKK
jgi:hypothetical protein